MAASVAPEALPTGKFTIIDLRSADAAKFRMVPLGLAGGFSCFMGVAQLGHGVFAKDRIARLDNTLASVLPQQSAPRTITVRRFDVFINRETEYSAVASNAAAGSVGGTVVGAPDVRTTAIWRTPKCAQDRMHSGWFNRSDLTNNNSPITVELDISVDGRSYMINSAMSPELPIDRLGVAAMDRSLAFAVMVDKSIEKALSRLAQDLSASPAN